MVQERRDPRTSRSTSEPTVPPKPEPSALAFVSPQSWWTPSSRAGWCVGVASPSRCGAWQAVTSEFSKAARQARRSLPNETELRDRSKWPMVRIEAHSQRRLVGYVAGYVIPTMRMAHCDSYQVRPESGRRLADHAEGLFTMGIGRWLLLAFLARLQDQGVKLCYGLAIKDSRKQHEKLVAYFERMGARPVRVVGSRISDLGDRLIWGGEGLIMEVDVDRTLSRWRRRIR